MEGSNVGLERLLWSTFYFRPAKKPPQTTTNVSSISRYLHHRQRYAYHVLWIACPGLIRLPQFPIVFEIVVNTASDTIEVKSAIAVDEEVTKTVQRLVDEFESCVTYLSESPDHDLSLPDAGDQPTPGRPMHQTGISEGGPADHRVIETVISELCSFLRIPAENVREDSSLFSLGLDSLKAVALSQRLRERGLFISPVDAIRAGSVRGVASASMTKRQQEIPSQEESGSELEKLLRQDLSADSVRLGRDDQVEITAATALQAGLLSQVLSYNLEFVALLIDLS